MVALRSSLLAALLALASIAGADAVADRSGPQGFDFLTGDWRVHHRIKRPTGEWYEFEGTCSMRPLMAGAANVEEHVFARPTGTTYGVAVRAYDTEKKHWSIWWVDSRYMSLMGEPAIGSFENALLQRQSRCGNREDLQRVVRRIDCKESRAVRGHRQRADMAAFELDEIRRLRER
jgi:hypothetical protein